MLYSCSKIESCAGKDSAPTATMQSGQHRVGLSWPVVSVFFYFLVGVELI